MSSSLIVRPIGLSCMVQGSRCAADRADLEKHLVQTCEGISNRLLYSRESIASAAVS